MNTYFDSFAIVIPMSVSLNQNQTYVITGADSDFRYELVEWDQVFIINMHRRSCTDYFIRTNTDDNIILLDSNGEVDLRLLCLLEDVNKVSMGDENYLVNNFKI